MVGEIYAGILVDGDLKATEGLIDDEHKGIQSREVTREMVKGGGDRIWRLRNEARDPL